MPPTTCGRSFSEPQAQKGAQSNLSVSNSLSGGDWELDEIFAMGDPAHVVQISRDRRVPTGEGQRGVARQRRVAALRIVVNLELNKLAFQITGIPEQHLIEKFSPHRPDQALDEWVGHRHIRHGLDFVDRENPKVRLPTVRLEERTMIGADMPRCALTVDGGVEQAAHVDACDGGSPAYANADEASVHWSITTSTQ